MANSRSTLLKALEKSVLRTHQSGFCCRCISRDFTSCSTPPGVATPNCSVERKSAAKSGAYCLHTALATNRRIEEDIATGRTSPPGIVLLRATSRAPLSHGCISKGAFPLKMSLRVDTQSLKVVGSFKESWICSNLQPSGPGHFFLGAARIVFSNIASSRVIGVSVLLKNSLGIGVSGVGCFAIFRQ